MAGGKQLIIPDSATHALSRVTHLDDDTQSPELDLTTSVPIEYRESELARLCPSDMQTIRALADHVARHAARLGANAVNVDVGVRVDAEEKTTSVVVTVTTRLMVKAALAYWADLGESIEAWLDSQVPVARDFVANTVATDVLWK